MDAGPEFILGQIAALPTRRELIRFGVLVALGLCIGVPTALMCVRVLRTMLYGITAHDPATLAMSIATLLASACFAAIIPLLRATNIDPASALRYE